MTPICECSAPGVPGRIGGYSGSLSRVRPAGRPSCRAMGPHARDAVDGWRRSRSRRSSRRSASRPVSSWPDIGAGTGIFSVPLARAVSPGGRVLSVEVDAGFLPAHQ